MMKDIVLNIRFAAPGGETNYWNHQLLRLKKGMAIIMKILSVDYGDARTGLAVCDDSEILASPLGVINENAFEKCARSIADKAKSSGAGLVIVGYPRNMDGSAGQRAQKSESLSKRLKALTGLEVKLWDERLTTVSATRALNETNVRGKKRKAVIDAVSAVILLESYLDYRRLKSNKR